MSYISIDTFREVWSDKNGEPKKNKAGEYQAMAKLRVRVDEGDRNTSFSLEVWRQIVAARGNKLVINETFVPEEGPRKGETIIGRSARLQSNGSGDDLIVEKDGDPRQVYNLQTGLAEAFARVCEQSQIAERSRA